MRQVSRLIHGGLPEDDKVYDNIGPGGEKENVGTGGENKKASPRRGGIVNRHPRFKDMFLRVEELENWKANILWVKVGTSLDFLDPPIQNLLARLPV